MGYIKIQIENNNGGWSVINADTKSLKFANKRVTEKEFSRLTADGDFLFFKDSYVFLQNLINRTPKIRIIQNGNQILESTIDLTQNDDLDFQIMKLKAVVEDKFTPFDNFGDTEYNIIEADNISALLNIIEDPIEIESLNFGFLPTFSASIIIDGNGMPTTGTYPFPELGWSLYSAIYQREVLLYDVNATWMRYRGYGYYDGDTATPPSGSGWIYLEDQTINTIVVPVYVKPLPVDVGWTEDPSKTYTNDVDITPNNNIYTRFKRVDTVLKYIVGRIDDSILFEDNEIPAITDSFYWMKTYVGEDYDPLYPIVPINSDKPYKDLLILALSDAIPQANGDEKTDGATKAMLTFNGLIGWFEQNGFYWKLEDRGGDSCFILDHYLDKTLKVGNNPNIQQQRINWIKKTKNINYITPTYNKIHNSETVGGSLNFVGFDVLFPNVNVNIDYQYGQQTILIDINDIRVFREEKYDEFSNNQFVIVSTVSYNLGFLSYYIKKATGDLIDNLENNIELCWSYISQRLISNLPDKTANINGNIVSLLDTRLEKRRRVKFPYPIQNIKDDIDITSLVQYFEHEAEADSVEMGASDDVAIITLRY